MPNDQNQHIVDIPLSSTPRFIASHTLLSSLQSVLLDLIELNLQGKQAH